MLSPPDHTHTDVGHTSLQDTGIAPGGDPLGQLSLALHAISHTQANFRFR